MTGIKHKFTNPVRFFLFVCACMCFFVSAHAGGAKKQKQKAMYAGLFYFEDPQELEFSTLELTGLWEVYSNKFIDPTLFYKHKTGGPPFFSDDASPEQYTIKADAFVRIPTLYNDIASGKNAKKGKGSATWHLRLKNLKPNFNYAIFMFDKIGTAVNFYCNGELVFSQGIAAQDYTKTVSARSMAIASIKSDSGGIADLVFHTSNDVYRKSGLWVPLRFGSENVVRTDFNHELNRQFFLCGALFIVFLYYFALFLFRKYDWASLYLSLFALTLFLRNVTTDFSLLLYYFPNVPFALDMKLEYTAIFAGPVFFVLYLVYLHTSNLENPAVTIVIGVGICLGILTWALPLQWSNRLVPINQAYMFISLLVVFIILFSQLNRITALFFLTLVSIFIIVAGAVYETLIRYMLTVPFLPVHFMPYTFVIFVFFQSIITAYQHEKASSAIDVLSGTLKKLNTAYFRFVPKQFLQMLNKNDIMDVEIGDWAVHNVTLLCADIRDFTALSEQLGGKKTFDLLNTYLIQIAPFIRKYGGFIEKYLGDGIVAVFPDNTPDVLYCAVKMQREIMKLKTAENLSLRIGIGIHYGSVVFGTAGSRERISQISISQAVDTVLYLEDLTKLYRKSILISGSALHVLCDLDISGKYKRFNFSKMDTSVLKKKLSEDIYSLDPAEKLI